MLRVNLSGSKTEVKEVELAPKKDFFWLLFCFKGSFLFKLKFPIENSRFFKKPKQPQLSVILPFGFWQNQKRKTRKKFKNPFCYICLENLPRQQKHALTISTKEKCCKIGVQERNTVTRHIYQR